MTAFAGFLSEKAERYIELRRSLGYAFNKQAGTLRAFVRYVEQAELDAPATRAMALNFVLSFGGAANSRAIRHGVLRRFFEYLAVYDSRTEGLERRSFSRSRAIPPPRILSEAELASLIDACARISPGIPLRGRTMAMLIGLSASSGLRSGASEPRRASASRTSRPREAAVSPCASQSAWTCRASARNPGRRPSGSRGK